jgi:hypothetical protein
MSALTKTTAKKTRKKPATRSVKKAASVARPKSKVAPAKAKKRLRSRLSTAPKDVPKSKGHRAVASPKAKKSSVRKSKSGRASNKALAIRTKRTTGSSKRQAPAPQKVRTQTSKKVRDLTARTSRRQPLKARPVRRPKTSGGITKRGRPPKQQLKNIQPKSKLQQRKENERLKKQQAKERARLSKLREQEKLRKRRDVEQARKQREQERLRRQREQQALRAQRAKELEQRAKDEEKRKKQQERDSKRQAEIRAREEERRRGQLLREEAKRAKEEERQRLKAEREAEREQVRRQKEEERAKRDAEREAYRKAKEAERERLRATREAQKRALEGRIAEATRNANKLGGGRSTTTRFYSPGAIPNQSGTTRRVSDTSLASSGLSNGLHLVDSQVQTHEGSLLANGTPGTGDETPRVPAPPERPLPTAESVEERFRIIEERLKEAPADFRHGYQEALDMSWIYHDSALEGVVYTFQELRVAIDQGTAAVADSSLQPVVEEVRRHKAAIDLVREMGEKKRAPITVDVIRKIYLTLHPEEGDLKTVKYRRDIPQHRLYFHEYAHPEKIQHKVRQIVDWLNGPEPKKLKSPIRVASRAHYELLRVFPFQSDSGKVARLFMNLLLLRAGHPPAIVHSTERQRYYEALRGALPTLIQMVTESILNGLVSIEKLLDDQDIKLRTSAS